MAQSTKPKKNNSDRGGHKLRVGISTSDLRTLSELGSVFNSDRTLDETLNWLDRHIKPLISHDRFVVDVLSADQKIITNIYVTGKGRPKLMPGESEPTKGTVAGHVASTGESFFDISVDESLICRFPAAEHTIKNGIRSWLVVPLIFDGTPFGSAAFLSHTENLFNERQLELAEIVSGYIASAVNTDRLVERLKAESSQLQRDGVRDAAIKDIALTIGSSLHIRDVFDDFSDLIKLLIPAEYISVVRIREGESIIRNPLIAGKIIRRDSVDLESSIAGHLARSRRSLLENLDGQTEIDEFLERFPAAEFDISHGFRSIMSVPLLAENRCVGAIHFRDRIAYKLTTEHIEIAEQIASYVAPAVVNADLHMEAQREADVQEMLAELSRLMASTVNVNDVLDDLRPVIDSVLPTDRMVISLIDSTGTERRAYVSGVPILAQDAEKQPPRSAGSHVARTNRVVTVTSTEEIDAATEVSDLVLYRTRQAGFRSEMFAPLISEDTLIGTLNVKSTWPNAYGEREKRTFTQIAQQLVGSIAASEYAAELRTEFELHETLAEIGKLVASAQNVETIYNQFAATIDRVVPSDELLIVTLLRDQSKARVRYHRGSRFTDEASVEIYDVANSQLERIISTGEPLLIGEHNYDDMEKEIPRMSLDVKHSLRSQITVPLITHGRTIGVLGVRSTVKDAYSKRHLALIVQVAGLIAGEFEKTISMSSSEKRPMSRRP